MLYKCVQSILRKHQTNTEKISSYKSDLVDLFRSLGLAPFENTPSQRSDEEHSRVFQISLDEVYLFANSRLTVTKNFTAIVKKIIQQYT